LGFLIVADHLLLSLLGERRNNIATLFALISSKLENEHVFAFQSLAFIGIAGLGEISTGIARVF
jgi:hypothetical protein